MRIRASRRSRPSACRRRRLRRSIAGRVARRRRRHSAEAPRQIGLSPRAAQSILDIGDSALGDERCAITPDVMRRARGRTKPRARAQSTPCSTALDFALTALATFAPSASLGIRPSQPEPHPCDDDRQSIRWSARSASRSGLAGERICALSTRRSAWCRLGPWRTRRPRRLASTPTPTRGRALERSGEIPLALGEGFNWSPASTMTGGRSIRAASTGRSARAGGALLDAEPGRPRWLAGRNPARRYGFRS